MEKKNTICSGVCAAFISDFFCGWILLHSKSNSIRGWSWRRQEMLLLSSARGCLRQCPVWWPWCGPGPLVKVAPPICLRHIHTFCHDVLQHSVLNLGQVFILSLLQLGREQEILWRAFPLKSVASFSHGGAVLLGFFLSYLASSILPSEWLPFMARTALTLKSV